MNTYHNRVPREARPEFVVFRVLTNEDYGVFHLRWADQSILFLMDSDGRPVNFFIDRDLRLSVEAAASPLVISRLLTGRLREYSSNNHIPVLPR